MAGPAMHAVRDAIYAKDPKDWIHFVKRVNLMGAPVNNESDKGPVDSESEGEPVDSVIEADREDSESKGEDGESEEEVADSNGGEDRDMVDESGTSESADAKVGKFDDLLFNALTRDEEPGNETGDGKPGEELEKEEDEINGMVKRVADAVEKQQAGLEEGMQANDMEPWGAGRGAASKVSDDDEEAGRYDRVIVSKVEKLGTPRKTNIPANASGLKRKASAETKKAMRKREKREGNAGWKLISENDIPPLTLFLVKETTVSFRLPPRVF
ncbi:hypothetical protein HK101_005017 [Irineochytrium annulatum]|nr:hypothetical protein HK101_005017 [Irineochytrium annulatum]